MTVILSEAPDRVFDPRSLRLAGAESKDLVFSFGSNGRGHAERSEASMHSLSAKEMNPAIALQCKSPAKAGLFHKRETAPNPQG